MKKIKFIQKLSIAFSQRNLKGTQSDKKKIDSIFFPVFFPLFSFSQKAPFFFFTKLKKDKGRLFPKGSRLFLKKKMG